jgi:DNA-binding XRE family transcriptional regulator
VNKLKAKLVENGLNVETLAKKLGLNPQTVYNKLNNDGFKMSEARKMGEILNLSSTELCEIFFA